MITDNFVFLFGSNENGQLGIPERSIIEVPRLCSFGVSIV